MPVFASPLSTRLCFFLPQNTQTRSCENECCFISTLKLYTHWSTRDYFLDLDFYVVFTKLQIQATSTHVDVLVFEGSIYPDIGV